MALAMVMAFAYAIPALETVVSASAANGFAAIGAQFSRMDAPPDTLRIKVATTQNLGALSLTDFKAKAVLIEPDASLDPNAAIHFSSFQFRFEGVTGRIVIRNLNFRADAASASFLVGEGTTPNGSLEMHDVLVSSDSLTSGFFTWLGTPSDSIVLRRCVFTAPKAGGGEWLWREMGGLRIESSLFRAPMRLRAEAHANVSLLNNTWVEFGLTLVGLPLNTHGGTLRLQGNHFIQNRVPNAIPITLGESPFGVFDAAEQRNNRIHGYTLFANATYQAQFTEPNTGNTVLAGTLPDAGELWLWRITSDTGVGSVGAFATGGLPHWNVRPGELEKRFPLSSTDQAALTFEAAEVPRLVGLSYAAANYPDSLGYRTRYRSDTALKLFSGTSAKIKPVKLALPAATLASTTASTVAPATPLGEYEAALLYGDGLTKVNLGAAPSGGILTYALTGVDEAKAIFVPALKPKTVGALSINPNFISKGKSAAIRVDGSENIKLGLGPVKRAGYLSTSQEVAPTLANDLRPLGLAGAAGIAGTALTLNGDAEVAAATPTTRASLTLVISPKTPPFDSSRIELFGKFTGQTAFTSLDTCSISKKGEDFVAECSFGLPAAGVPGLAEWRGTFVLAEKLSVPKSASLTFDLGLAKPGLAPGQSVSLQIESKKGFQYAQPVWSAVDTAWPGTEYLNDFTPMVRVDMPGRPFDSLATVNLLWSGLTTEHKLYRMVQGNAGQVSVAPLTAQTINSSPATSTVALKANITENRVFVFAAKSYTVPRNRNGKAYSGDFGFITVSGMTSTVPANIAVDRDFAVDTGVIVSETIQAEIEGRTVLAKARFKGDSLQVVLGWQMVLKSHRDSTVEKALFWVHGQDDGIPLAQATLRLEGFTCKADTCRLPGPTFRREMRIALLGPKPKPPVKPDTPIVIDTPIVVDTSTQPTIPTQPNLPRGPLKLVEASGSSGAIGLVLALPENLDAHAVKGVRVEKLTLNDSLQPIWQSLQGAKPGDTVTLRRSGALDLGYRVTFLDSAGQALGTSATGSLSTLKVSMRAKNAALDKAPAKAPLKRHLLGWSLPNMQRDSAFNVWMPGSKAADRSKDSLEWHTLTSEGRWQAVTSDRAVQGKGYLIGARQALRPRFPDEVEITARDITLPLTKGWNVIANPFAFTLGEAAMNAEALNHLELFQRFDGNLDKGERWQVTDVFEPMTGYVVYAEREVDLKVSPFAGAPQASPGQGLAAKSASTAAVAAETHRNLYVTVVSPTQGAISLRATSQTRGARHLEATNPGAFTAWLNSGYRVLPKQSGGPFDIELTVHNPQAGKIGLTIEGSSGSSSSTHVLLIDKQTGESTLLDLAQAKTDLDLPAGTWRYRLATGQLTDLENIVARQQAGALRPKTLAMRPLGAGRGQGGTSLWQIGVPGFLGYRDIGIAGYDAQGRQLWKRRLTAPGAGWHTLALPVLKPGLLVQLQALGAGRNAAYTHRIGGRP